MIGAVMLAAAVATIALAVRRRWLHALIGAAVLAVLLVSTAEGHAAVTALTTFGRAVAQ